MLSEEEIDDTFKTLFSKLAGEVCQGLAGVVGWEPVCEGGEPSRCCISSSLGHGDQRQGAADHLEQDNQQT